MKAEGAPRDRAYLAVEPLGAAVAEARSDVRDNALKMRLDRPGCVPEGRQA
jgi:hypothetical protein